MRKKFIFYNKTRTNKIKLKLNLENKTAIPREIPHFDEDGIRRKES